MAERKTNNHGFKHHQDEDLLTLPVNFPPGCSEIDYIYKCVDDLIYALAAIDSCEVEAGMAAKLKQDIRESKAKYQAERRTSSAESSSISSSQSPSSTSYRQQDNISNISSGMTKSPGTDFTGLANEINSKSMQDPATTFNLDSLGPADVE